MAAKAEAKVTDDDLEEARAALAQGNAELVRLQESFYNGAGEVTWDQVKAQQGVIEFAEAQIERLARSQARYQAQVRLDAVNALHDDIQSHALGIGGNLADSARTYYAARQAFLKLAESHNATVAGFVARAQALNVPASNGRPVPFARDGKLALPQNGGGIHAGRRRLEAINGPSYLEQIDTRGEIDAVVASLSTIDAELPEPGEQVHYRGAGGGVFSFDLANEPSAEEIKRTGLIKLTRAEAWGEDD